MVHRRCKEDENVVKIDEAKLPLHGGNNNILCRLETCRGVLHPEWHLGKPNQAMMGRCFNPVTIVDFNLSVPGASVQCREHVFFSQAVDEFVHKREEIQVAFGDGVQLPIVDVEVGRTVFLGDEYTRCCAIRSRRFYDVFHNPLNSFCGRELPCRRHCPILGKMNRPHFVVA